MNELDIQRLIVKSCKNQGGYGLKMDNKYVAGIPDLLLSMPSTGPAIIEVKVKAGRLTPLQIHTVKKMRAGGIATGWCYVERYGNGNAGITMHTGRLFLKIRGEEWPIEDMITNCKNVTS